MRIGRKATLEEIEPRHWDRFAADVCIDGFHLQRPVRLLCEAILAQLNSPDSRLNQMLPDGAPFIRLADLLEIGRAHLWTQVTNAHLVCTLLLVKQTILHNDISIYSH